MLAWHEDDSGNRGRFGTFFVSIYLAVVEWAPSINQHKWSSGKKDIHLDKWS
jgi:hypothetical protein